MIMIIDVLMREFVCSIIYRLCSILSTKEEKRNATT